MEGLESQEYLQTREINSPAWALLYCCSDAKHLTASSGSATRAATPHPTHAHVDMALEWLKRAGAAQGVLTNMHVDLDYNELAARLPESVRPAFDGMQIEFDL